MFYYKWKKSICKINLSFDILENIFYHYQFSNENTYLRYSYKYQNTFPNASIYTGNCDSSSNFHHYEIPEWFKNTLMLNDHHYCIKKNIYEFDLVRTKMQYPITWRYRDVNTNTFDDNLYVCGFVTDFYVHFDTNLDIIDKSCFFIIGKVKIPLISVKLDNFTFKMTIKTELIENKYKCKYIHPINLKNNNIKIDFRFENIKLLLNTTEKFNNIEIVFLNTDIKTYGKYFSGFVFQ